MCIPAPRSGLQSIQIRTSIGRRRLQSMCRVLRSKASRIERGLPHATEDVPLGVLAPVAQSQHLALCAATDARGDWLGTNKFQR